MGARSVGPASSAIGNYSPKTAPCGGLRGFPDRQGAAMLAIESSQIVSNLEQAWEITGGGEDQLTATMMQISPVVAR